VEEADISRGKISAFTESLDAAFESVEDFSKLKDLKVAGGHNGDGMLEYRIQLVAFAKSHRTRPFWMLS
jgi:hypothetical protein